MHHDLKARNFVRFYDGRYLLVDFDNSRTAQTQDMGNTTMEICAPEVGDATLYIKILSAGMHIQPHTHYLTRPRIPRGPGFLLSLTPPLGFHALCRDGVFTCSDSLHSHPYPCSPIVTVSSPAALPLPPPQLMAHLYNPPLPPPPPRWRSPC